jgi:hypothetical protein
MNAALFLGIIVSLVSVACFWAFRSGRDSAGEDSAKAETKAAKADAQKWADRPRNAQSAIERLRIRAEWKRKARLQRRP